MKKAFMVAGLFLSLALGSYVNASNEEITKQQEEEMKEINFDEFAKALSEAIEDASSEEQPEEVK